MKNFEKVVKPVIEWLQKNMHPHSKVIIENDKAELVEGVSCVVYDKITTLDEFNEKMDRNGI